MYMNIIHTIHADVCEYISTHTMYVKYVNIHQHICAIHTYSKLPSTTLPAARFLANVPNM